LAHFCLKLTVTEQPVKSGVAKLNVMSFQNLYLDVAQTVQQP
jgi:hypothetical protein